MCAGDMTLLPSVAIISCCTVAQTICCSVLCCTVLCWCALLCCATLSRVATPYLSYACHRKSMWAGEMTLLPSVAIIS
jgi:hypothetical protein